MPSSRKKKAEFQLPDWVKARPIRKANSVSGYHGLSVQSTGYGVKVWGGDDPNKPEKGMFVSKQELNDPKKVRRSAVPVPPARPRVSHPQAVQSGKVPYIAAPEVRVTWCCIRPVPSQFPRTD